MLFESDNVERLPVTGACLLHNNNNNNNNNNNSNNNDNKDYNNVMTK